MKKALEEVAQKINTKEDLIFFLEEINVLENLLFKNTKKPLSEKAEKTIGRSLGALLKNWEKEGVIPLSPNQAFSFFEKLKKELQKLPQVELEIAFQPSEDFILKIKKWLEEATGKKLVLNFVIKPEIIGGVVIEYQGKRENFSLVKKINPSIF